MAAESTARRGDTRAERPATPIGEFLQGWRRGDRAMSADDRRAVTEEFFAEGEERRRFLLRFFILVVLSTLIAALGLVTNSVAVVIGAMLIAPLMTPILGTAASLLLADPKRLLGSILILLGGTAVALATAVLATRIALSSLTGSTGLPAEILSRTSPSLVDLGVAIAAGLAAGYVASHPRAGAALPGVAVAVALVPPLATAGITLELGASEEAQGALLLYATNLVAILLSAIVVMLASGFVPPELRIRGLRHVRVGLVVTLVALLLIAVPLTVHTIDVVRDQRLEQRVSSIILSWDPNATIVDLQGDVTDGTHATVDLTIATTSREPAPAWRLADLVSRETGLIVDLAVRYRLEAQDAATAG